MDDKVAGHCQNCDKPLGPSNTGQTENGKTFCCMGCLKAYREAKTAAAAKG